MASPERGRARSGDSAQGVAAQLLGVQGGAEAGAVGRQQVGSIGAEAHGRHVVLHAQVAVHLAGELQVGEDEGQVGLGRVLDAGGYPLRAA